MRQPFRLQTASEYFVDPVDRAVGTSFADTDGDDAIQE
jgi:hypothetical protein